MIIGMTKRLVIFVAVCFLCSVVYTEPRGKTLIKDGLSLAGVDGKLVRGSNSDDWFFEFDSEIVDDSSKITAGSKLELLPSAALERMIIDANESRQKAYRLWGKVIKYKDKNFIFGVYFLTFSEISEPNSNRIRPKRSGPTINEPNDELVMPDEIIAKLTTKKIIRPVPLKKGLEIEADFILADRTGFIVGKDDNGLVFEFDCLGQSIQGVSIKLLPCQKLERAQKNQLSELEPLRVKVAGIVTKYKSEYYLLLQRATRVYSHQNF